MWDPQQRQGFLALSAVFEGLLFLAAAVLVYLFPLQKGVDPLILRDVDWPASAFWGAVLTLPLLGLFWVCEHLSWKPLREIRQFLLETLGPILATCRWYDLLAVAVLAGVCEEALFRGALQPRLGLFGASLAFGLAHWITPAYAVLAGLMGAYLGWIADEYGLVSAILAHTLYDFAAFLMVRNHVLRSSPPASLGEKEL